MSSEMRNSNIYTYCLVHKVPYKFIGLSSGGKAVVQCPICLEKRIVPNSWVNGLTSIPQMGNSIEERFDIESQNKIKRIMEAGTKKKGQITKGGHHGKRGRK